MARLLLLTTLLTLTSACDSSHHSPFPMRVTVAFLHGGERYQSNFLTVVSVESVSPLQAFETCNLWLTPKRRLFPISLADGSLLIVRVNWNRCMRLEREGDTTAEQSGREVTSRWYWLDDAVHPSFVVEGTFGAGDSIGAAGASPIKDSMVEVVARRLGKDALSEAEAEDQEGARRILIIDQNRTSPPFDGGALFAGIETAQVGPAQPADLVWEDIGNGCRISRGQKTLRSPLAPPSQDANGEDIKARNKWIATWLSLHPPRYALENHDMLDLDGGPMVRGILPGLAILYPAGTVVRMVRTQAKSCSIPDLWPLSTAALVDFGDGDVRSIRASREFVLLNGDFAK